MKHGAVISTAILFLLLGITAPAYAQHEQQGKEQGKSDQGKQQPQGKPAPQPHQQQAARESLNNYSARLAEGSRMSDSIGLTEPTKGAVAEFAARR
ncbi:MAG: hypothetical protein ABSG52_11150, partial [Terriglobales bacterium]